MAEISRNNLVVQANKLVQQTNTNMDAVPLKIFKSLISCIDTKHPPKDNTVTISKKGLRELLGYEDTDKNYTTLRKQMKSLQGKVVEIQEDNGDILSVTMIPTVTWKKNTDEVLCEFHREIMPYLIELQERFLEYPVGHLPFFHSKYGIVLYEYLLSTHRQYGDYVINITIDQLRFITGTQKKYKEYKDLKRNVINPAIEDINQNKDLEFLCKAEPIQDPAKRTRYKSIRFTIRRRTSVLDEDFNVPHKAEKLTEKI